MSRWVDFTELKNPGRKTKIWAVTSKAGFHLGVIKWWGSWRQYCFFPDGDTLYNRECLGDIAIFIDQVMNLWRTERAKQ